MYACIPEIDGGFFEGVCALNNQTCISSDPPPPYHSWIASCRYRMRLTRFLPLTAANVYSLLQYLVLGNKLQGGEIGHPPLLQGQPMQDRGYGLLRIRILRTPVNKRCGSSQNQSASASF
jgi:hypothetical protein